MESMTGPSCPSSRTRSRARHRRPLAPVVAAALAASLHAPAGAQDGSPAGAAGVPIPSGPAAGLESVQVTGNPLRSGATPVPASSLQGESLLLRSAPTLGETLDGLPGVAGTRFGPNSDRPVIRGLDGDRIRILGNSGATIDASSLSFDHAVPVEPLVVERIEVLRGPASLLYGGSAVGGVVNLIDNRIPRSPLTGATGLGQLRAGGAASERSGSALLEAGDGRFALHADAFYRDTDDLRVPTFTRPDGVTASRVENSASRSRGGALGASWTSANGYLGASYDGYEKDYGVVVEPEVTIRMRSERFSLAGERRALEGPLRAARFRIANTDYRHDELEGQEVGTRFANRGTDGRVELEHAPIGPLRGVLGLQSESSRFSALGEEAFVPSTRTRGDAVFVHEEWAFEGGRATFGGRVERARVSSEGDAPDAPEPRFGAPSSRSFAPRSAAVGLSLDLAPKWRLDSNLAYTERAPTFYELYANGVHVATGAYERGDPTLNTEKGTALDVALGWRDGPHRLKAGVFASRFRDFISLDYLSADSGATNEEGEPLPLYAFQAVPARFEGAEIEGATRLASAPARIDLSGKLDWVRARNRDTGEPLPRIAPLRLTLAVDLRRDRWGGRAELVHAARQDDVPAYDSATDGYTLLNLAATYRFRLGSTSATLFARANNLTDQLAFNASSIQTVRGYAPLAGRSLLAGVQIGF